MLPGMDKSLIDDDWKYLCQFLLDNLSESAKASGAVERWRNIKSGEELLRVILAGCARDDSVQRVRGGPSVMNLLRTGSSAPGRIP